MYETYDREALYEKVGKSHSCASPRNTESLLLHSGRRVKS
jgi:hypothetical protein